MARLVAGALTAIVFAITSPVMADPSDADAAEEAFQRGRALLAENRYELACQAFDASQRFEPASGTLLALAYCQERAGLLASALTNYHLAAELSDREGQVERRDAAKGRSQDIAQRVSRLTIVVSPTLASQPGLYVTRNGTPVEPNNFGTPMPVDGGQYRVSAALADRPCWSSTISIEGEKDQKTVVIEVQLPAPPGSPATNEAPVREPAREKATPLPDRSLPNPLESASLVLALGGIAGLGVGVAYGIVADADNRASNRDGHCDARGCDATGMARRNDALAAARVSNACFVLGGAFTLGSVALYAGSKLKHRAKSMRVGMSAGRDGAELTLLRSF